MHNVDDSRTQDDTKHEAKYDAQLRRRRMQRRRSMRQAKRGMVAAAVLAVVLFVMERNGPRPTGAEKPLPSVGEVLGLHGPTQQTVAAAPRLVRQEPLAAIADQPMWRRAGDVLKRSKTSPSATQVAGQVPSQHEYLNRWQAIQSYSARYRIKTELARRIYDASIAAGIEPELGFRVVRVESVFDPRAVSSAGALGLTQLMLGTARAFEPNVTREDLLDPDVNLRIGFRYLRGLIKQYKGDLMLALVAYNRGPVAVQRSLAMGVSPANGYEKLITRGYRGNGILD